MSPIRSKPFRTKSAGQQTTKVLDGKMRVFPSTSDVGNYVRKPGLEADLTVRFIESYDWTSPESTSNPDYGVGSSNQITGNSTNTLHNSTGWFIIAVNKMCRIHYSFYVSSEQAYDWGYVTLSEKGTNYTAATVTTGTGNPVNLINRMSGNVTAQSSVDMTDWRTLNNLGDAYDIGVSGEEGEMLLVLKYQKDSSASSGQDRFTVNYLYFEDIP